MGAVVRGGQAGPRKQGSPTSAGSGVEHLGYSLPQGLTQSPSTNPYHCSHRLSQVGVQKH